MTRRKKPARKKPSAARAHASIDRLEGEVAVLLVDGEERHVPRARLPKEAREGDVVDLSLIHI